MTIRASDRITLAVVASPSYVRQYYLLQASTLNPPAAPTTNPPVTPWTTVEPNYTEGSTSTLYTVMLTAYGSVAFEYGPVQKSSSYEAAKAAYNKAAAAITVANLAEQAAADLIRASQTDPGHAPGRIWIILDAQGNTVGIKQSVNGVWASYGLMADQVIVPGSMGTVSLKDGAVTAAKVTASDELWAKIATFAKVTTQHLLAGGATITGTLLADVITLASRLVAGDPEGGRTELDSTGLHVFQGSTEKVRVSASALNGLQVWNPAMNAMVDLASSAFGTQILKFDDKVTVPTPGSASAFGEWKPGAWVFQTLGNWTSATNRVQVFSTTSLGDWGVGQSFGVRIAFTMQPVGGGTEIQLTDTGGEYGAVINRASPSPNFNIVNCDPGVEYSIRLQAQAIRYQGTSGGTPWIKNSRISLAPI